LVLFADKLLSAKLDILQLWLKVAAVAYRDVGGGEGLHVAALKNIEGFIDSRLFVEPYGLLLTTELEIRPMALLPMAADLGRINMDYPILKIFLDVVDDATPQLVIAGVLQTHAGLTLEQTAQFASSCMDATRQLAAECLALDYLFAEGRSRPIPSKNSLH